MRFNWLLSQRGYSFFTQFESIRVHWAPIPRYIFTRIVVYISSRFSIYMDDDFGKKNEQMHLFITSNSCVLYTHMSV